MHLRKAQAMLAVAMPMHWDETRMGNNGGDAA